MRLFVAYITYNFIKGPKMSIEQEGIFFIEEINGQFRVSNKDSGISYLSTGNKANAQHYLELMEKAYQLGFKAGYKKAKIS